MQYNQGCSRVTTRKLGQQPLRNPPTYIRTSRDVKNNIGVGRRPAIVIWASQSPQQSSEASGYVEIEVEYSGKEFIVPLSSDLLKLPVSVIKEKVVLKLKEVKPTVFGELVFGAADVTLYTDKARQKEIARGTLMQTSTREGFFGKLVVAGGQSENQNLTKGLKKLSEATVSKNVIFS